MAKQKYDNDELTTYYQNIYSAIEAQTTDDPYGNYVLSRIKSGQKKVFNKTQTEIRNFDMSFLDTIESVYPAILKIVRDPKKSIRYEEEIVSVEKAKKVNSQTVRHLSSHTQLIKEITKEGDVIPSKVMTTFAEEEIAIYENRFIKSLVKRMEMFLERRYEVMKVSLESFEAQRLNVSNEFLLSGQKVSIKLDIEVKNDLTTNVETTKEQYKRLLYIREMVQGLKGTEFMRALAKARDVLPPIMKTNIILHNPDFKLCYGLWLYLDRVDGISQDIDVKEKNYRYSSIFERDINQCMSLALTAFIKNREIEGIYTSKNLPSIKAPKVLPNEDIELELNLNADNKKLEDYTMNQILLDETAKFFEASVSGMQRTGNTYNESIRVVYRQMLEMLDQIYPRAFGVSDDELESKNLYEQLEYARRKQMILKIVRQQKQMNLARMGKEEKHIEKVMEKLNKKIEVEEIKARERLEKQRQKEEAQRLAALEKQRKLEERQRRLEEQARKMQEEQERREAAQKAKTLTEQRAQRARELAMKRREHLANMKKRAAEQEALTREDEELALQQAQENAAEAPVEEIIYVDEAGNPVEQVEAEVAQEAQEEVQPEEVPVEEADAVEETPAEEVAEDTPAEEVQEEQPVQEETIEDAQSEEQSTEVAEEPEAQAEEVHEEVQPEEETPAVEEEPTEEATEDDEFLAALDNIPEGKPSEDAETQTEAAEVVEEAPAEEVAEDTPAEEVQEEQPVEDETTEDTQSEDTPAVEEDNTEDDEFLAALGSIPEGKPSEEAEASTEEEFDEDEFLAALGDIPEGESKFDGNEEEEVIYVDEDGNPVDEFGNPITPDVDESDMSALDQAADDYERMLKESGMTDEEIAAMLGIPTEEAEEAPVEEEFDEDAFMAALGDIPEGKPTDTNEEAQNEPVEPENGESNDDEDEFLAALDNIPEGKPTEEAPVEEVAEEVQEDTPAVEEDNTEEDEFLAALDSIPEGKPSEEAEASTEEEFDEDEFLAALGDIPEGESKFDGNEEEEVIYVDEDGNPVDEFGNPITPDVDESDMSALDQAADDYERMLKESGMTDEEIATMLGIPTEED